MIAQKSSRKEETKNVQSLEYINLNAMFHLLVSPPSLSSFFP